MAKRSEEPAPPPPENGCEIPLLEDAASIQIALTRVLTALAAGKITPPEANAFIYGLRLARLNLAKGRLIDGASAEAYIQYENGDVVGPEQFREEATKPEHPLLDSGMMALRHLAERLGYEAVLDAHLTAGTTPPKDHAAQKPPPARRPSLRPRRTQKNGSKPDGKPPRPAPWPSKKPARAHAASTATREKIPGPSP